MAEHTEREPKSNKTGDNRRRRSRFSLRSFLLFVTILAFWLGWTTFIASHQRAALRIVQESGGNVYYKHQAGNRTASPPIRDWLASKLGEEFVFSIAGVYLRGEQVDDVTAQRLAPHLKHLRFLQWIEFRGTSITDAGMRHLEGASSLERLFVRPSYESDFNKSPSPIQLTHAALGSVASLKNLKVLSINDGKINGEGFKMLTKLAKLEELDLRGTDIEDAALEHLRGLAKLKQVCIWETSISDAGMAHLASLVNLENIYLSNTDVGDRGLRLLAQNASLRVIDAADTPVTDHGLQDFGRLHSLHELRLNGTSVSNKCLVHLAGLKNLRILQLGNTNITDSGLAELESWRHLQRLEVSNNKGVTNAAIVRLRAALPQCRVD